MSFPRISNFDVLIRKIEKNKPTITASRISVVVNRNSGKKYMDAPVLIKIGGSIIFLSVIGFFADFKRRNIIPTAIQRAIILDRTAKFMFYLLLSFV
ncbi:hypothetical protein DJ94_4812 [Bacillus pseudomycoides]|nr:hypothetical protein DJ94_4812 [Bacillus pseudomycoides]